MVRWRVSLAGETFDLEDLQAMFTSPRLKVVEEDGTFYLESSRFEGLNDSQSVHAEARRLLPMLNGAARLRSRSFRSVSVDSSVVELSAGGRKDHAVVLAETIALRSKVNAVIVRVGEEAAVLPSRPTEQDGFLELAARDDDVAEVLGVWGSRPHDWFNLYKVFEIIGSRADIKGLGWASDNEITRFTRTANHPQAAGEEARHGRSSVDPPPRPMTLSEGDAFVERILTEWLRAQH